jgi:hypothetical protein
MKYWLCNLFNVPQYYLYNYMLEFNGREIFAYENKFTT